MLSSWQGMQLWSLQGMTLLISHRNHPKMCGMGIVGMVTKCCVIDWKNFKQLKGKNVQVYTQEIRIIALLLGVYFHSQDSFLKYIGGLHTYLRDITLMFNRTSLDEVCVQATHLEVRGKKIRWE